MTKRNIGGVQGTVSTHGADDYVKAVKDGKLDRTFLEQMAGMGDPLATYIVASLDGKSVPAGIVQQATKEMATESVDQAIDDAKNLGPIMSLLAGLSGEDDAPDYEADEERESAFA